MLKQIDLRGLTCPEPVLRTKRLLDDKELQEIEIEALVDGQVNVNNLLRLARSLKLRFTSETHGNCFKIMITRGENDLATPVKTITKDRAHDHQVNEELSLRNLNDSISVGTVVFLGKDKFGEGDEEFSRTLTSIFLQTMYEAGHRPRAILLANTGVRLLAKDSSSHKVLSDFKAAGVEVWACGLCVEYYKLKNEIPIEQITNMFAICEYIFAADRLVTV